MHAYVLLLKMLAEAGPLSSLQEAQNQVKEPCVLLHQACKLRFTAFGNADASARMCIIDYHTETSRIPLVLSFSPVLSQVPSLLCCCWCVKFPVNRGSSPRHGRRCDIEPGPFTCGNYENENEFIRTVCRKSRTSERGPGISMAEAEPLFFFFHISCSFCRSLHGCSCKPGAVLSKDLACIFKRR
jgi:hypothetical protein